MSLFFVILWPTHAPLVPRMFLVSRVLVTKRTCEQARNDRDALLTVTLQASNNPDTAGGAGKLFVQHQI